MECRAGCGACCIAPSIASAMPGMPYGKPAGTACLHLSGGHLCTLFDQPERPGFCSGLQASKEMCGACFQDAFDYLSWLEEATKPETSKK